MEKHIKQCIQCSELREFINLKVGTCNDCKNKTKTTKEDERL